MTEEDATRLIEAQIQFYPSVKYRLNKTSETIDIRTKVACDRASEKTGVRISDFYHSRGFLFDVKEIYNIVSRYQDIVNLDEEELKEEERAELMD